MTSVRAFTVGHTASGWARSITEVEQEMLGPGDTVIAVEYSCINYKDGLASSETGRVARLDPLVPGVDLAGEVIESADPSLAPGTKVLVNGFDLGVSHHGGYAARAVVPSEWVVRLPEGLTTRTAMMVGTAGYTAALSVDALERAGLQPGTGPVLVTGATGGVGSFAVGMLAARGYEVVASTGKESEAEWLRSIGAAAVIHRSELTPEKIRPLESERWVGAVDCVGGQTLAYVLATMRYGCSVAASGLTGGSGLPTTVMPFILRGVNLLGIDSVQTPIGPRRAMWERIATDLKPTWLDSEEWDVIGLDALPEALDRILSGGMRGRTLVDPTR
ncbi:MAG TPA: oxidoreductase [Acidimicrobiaceae bacterium]|nr:oxidoreductase [Acidimicrobiaceae bacterium]